MSDSLNAGKTAPPGERALVFTAGNRSLAIPVSAVCEVLPMMELARPAGIPPLCAGYLTLEKQAVPVIRTSRIFGAPDDPEELDSKLIIVRSRNDLVALLVSEVLEIVPLENLTPLPVEDTPAGVVAGTLPGDVTLLEPAGLLLEQERLRMNELREIEQKRLDALRPEPS